MYHARVTDTKVTVASLRSVLIDPERNLDLVRGACSRAERDGARLLLCPELQLTGHGAHDLMAQNAEPVPDGPMSRELLALSERHGLCLVVGLAELSGGVVYNSMLVADHGRYLGVQRKIHMSRDEYVYFGCGESVERFDIGGLSFGITICYDNNFQELSLAHALHDVDVILAPHAARRGEWPAEPDAEFLRGMIELQQSGWKRMHCARAVEANAYVLICNVVGPATEGLPGVVANHVGTVLAVAPSGDVIHETQVDGLEDEIVTLSLSANAREFNRGPTRSRRWGTSLRILEQAFAYRRDRL